MSWRGRWRTRLVSLTPQTSPRLVHRHVSATSQRDRGYARERRVTENTDLRRVPGATSWRHHVEWRYRRHDTLSQPSHRGTRQHDMWREARLKHHVEEAIMSTSACRCAWTAHGSTTTRHSARAHCGHLPIVSCQHSRVARTGQPHSFCDAEEG